MSFWGRLWGSSEAVNTVVGGVRDGLDALVYTDEEKANDSAKERSEARSMLVGWMAATQGQNLARRLIALVVTGVWVTQYITVQILSIISIWIDNPEKIKASAAVISDAAQSMNGAMMLILGFYFAMPHMGKIADAALTKFGGKK